jgi:hypothetical protein
MRSSPTEPVRCGALRLAVTHLLLDNLWSEAEECGELPSGAYATAVKPLAGFHFHAHHPRHTFACAGLERGGSQAALQAVLGHSTIVTTQRYARLSQEYVWAEAERTSGRSVADSVAPRVGSDSQDTRKIAAAGRLLNAWSDGALMAWLFATTLVFSVGAHLAYVAFENRARQLGRLDQTTLF